MDRPSETKTEEQGIPRPLHPPPPPPVQPPQHPRAEQREQERAVREQWAEREREMERRERTRSEREWDRDKVREGPRSRSRSRDRRRKERAKSKEKKSEKKGRYLAKRYAYPLVGGKGTQMGWDRGSDASNLVHFFLPQRKPRRNHLPSCWMTFSERPRQLPASIGSH